MISITKRIAKNVLIKPASVLFNKRLDLDSNTAYGRLEQYSPCSNGKCYTTHKVNIQYDLQIIIPAYNVEKYIRECLTSVIAQKTQYTVFVTIVNDGSTDQTKHIIETFLNENLIANSQNTDTFETASGTMVFQLITQPNKGLSGARNTALDTICGEYVMFVDSDDLLPANAIESMLDMAKKAQADIVQGGWTEFSVNTVYEYSMPKSGIIEFSDELLSGFAWGKIYRWNVLQHFDFPQGFWFEDTPVSFILYAMPFRFAAVKESVYKYRRNPQGITLTAPKQKRAVDSFWITKRCLEEFPEFGLNYNQRAYEYLLRQIVTNGKRTKFQPKAIRESIFILSRDLLDQYFTGFNTKNKRLKPLENAIRNQQFSKYVIILLSL